VCVSDIRYVLLPRSKPESSRSRPMSEIITSFHHMPDIPFTPAIPETPRFVALLLLLVLPKRLSIFRLFSWHVDLTQLFKWPNLRTNACHVSCTNWSCRPVSSAVSNLRRRYGYFVGMFVLGMVCFVVGFGYFGLRLSSVRLSCESGIRDFCRLSCDGCCGLCCCNYGCCVVILLV